MRYEDASQTGSMSSDVTARDDAEHLAGNDFAPAIGNLITGTGTVSGSAGTDMAGAGAQITAISGAGGSDSSFDASGKLEVIGQYGTLTIDAQGNYTYARNAGSPEGVSDTFTYTLANSAGATDDAKLVIAIGNPPILQAQGTQTVQTADGVVVLPAGVDLSDVRVVGRDLVITLPDGTTMTIPDGAIFVPQLVVDGVAVPASNVAALLIDSEPRPAAGDGGANQQSSGGNFGIAPPPLDPGVPLGDLLPPTELDYTPPELDDPGDFIDEENEAPLIGVSAVNVSEEGVSIIALPNPDNVGSPDTTNSPTNGGVIPVSDPDGDPITLSLGTPSTSLTSQGVAITWSVSGDGHTLTGSAGGNTVLTLVINDAGAYTVTLVRPVDHPTAGGEQGTTFVVPVSVSDGEDFTSGGAISVTIEDDSPLIEGQIAEPNLTVDDTTFNINDTDSVTGAFAVSYGADGPAASTPISYAMGINAGATGLFDTQSGAQIVLTLEAGVVVGRAGAGGPVVFTVSIDGSGNVTLDQSRAVRHDDPNDPVESGASAATLSADNLVTVSIVATDRDGDTASLTVNIGQNLHFEDDGPSATQAQLTGTVDEDGVVENYPAPNQSLGDGVAGGPPGVGPFADVAGEVVSATGNVGALFASGNDLPLTFSIINDFSSLTSQGLTSQGVPLSYSVALASGVYTLTAEAPAGNVIFTFTLNSTTGAYNFTLVDQLDHPTLDGLPGDNLENDMSIALGSIIRATDGDGDSVNALANGLVITVDDDTPVAVADANTLTVEYENFDVESIVATWTAWDLDIDGVSEAADGDPQPNTFDRDGDSAIDEIRWGDPQEDDQSGYGFVDNPALASASVLSNTPFSLGTFTHYNNPIEGPELDAVTLQISFVANLNGTLVPVGPIDIVFNHDETENDGTPEQNRDIIDITLGTTTIMLGGIEYEVEILGLVNEMGDLVTQVRTFEGQANNYELMVRFVPTSALDLEGNVLLNDSSGADEPILVTAASGFDGSSDSTPDGDGNLVVNGQYGTLTINEDGSYTYTLTANPNDVPPGTIEHFTYSITDYDGDGTTANLDITIDIDQAPVAAAEEARSDDDGLAGNPASVTGDLDANAGESGPANPSEAVYRGQFTSTGGDGAITYSLAHLNGTSVMVGTESVDLTWAGNTLTATGPRGPLFTIEVNPTTGEYVLTQLDNVLHSAGGNENDAVVALTFRATDADTDTVFGAFEITFDDDAPTVTGSQTQPELTTDDTTLGVNASAAFAGVFTPAFGADGAAAANSVTYALGVSAPGGVASGLFDVASGNQVFLFLEGGQVVGREGNNPGNAVGGDIVFIVSVNSSGVVTLDQVRAVQHNDPADPVESGASAAGLSSDGLVTLIATVTDGDGDTASASVGIGSNLHFEDDGPSITATGSQPTLTVDDTTLGTNASSSFAGVFTPVFGADGQGTPPVAYALGVSAPGGVASGLVDVASGNQVYLFLEGGQVVGREGTSPANAVGGDIVFTVSVSGSGVVTLDQARAVQHDDPADHDEAGSPAMLSADNLITLTATVEDGDGDTATASANIGQNLQFRDDGPSIIASGAEPTLTVDDTTLGTNASSSFAGAFIPNFGADGQGSPPVAYALGVSAPGGVASGVFDVATGNQVFLFLEGGQVVGREGTSAGDAVAGDIVFTVSVSGTGVVTLDQVRAVQHNDPADPVESGASAAGLSGDNLITLIATVEDGDGDTASASVNIGSNLRFEDDGPSIIASGAEPTLTVDDTTLGTNASSSFAGAFIPNFGADGQGTPPVAYALGVSAPGGVASGVFDVASGNQVYLFLEGGQVVGREGTSPANAVGGDIVFTVSVNGSGVVTLDQVRAVQHNDPADPVESGASAAGLSADNLITLIATVEDGDGDTASASIGIGSNLRFEDDGPSITATGSQPTLTVDDTTLGTNASSSFAGAFTPIFGADGQGTPPVAYALGVSAPGGVASGLFDVATGNQVFLFLEGGVVVGREGTSAGDAVAGDIVFNVSVSGTGVVTLDQVRAVQHNDPADPVETGGSAAGLSADNLITLIATVEDGDGDTASASIGIGSNLRFEDDGPSIIASGAEPQLVVDDTTLGTNASQSFAGHFIPNFGADGQGTPPVAYALGVSAPGVASGVFDVATGNQVFLFLEGGQVVGREGTNAGDAVAGDIVFTVSVNGAGLVTLDQVRAVTHNDPADPVETGASAATLISDNLITLTATVEDGDGDTATATIGIGQNLRFEDDGPDAFNEPQQNVAEGATVAGTFDFNQGADGASVTHINGVALAFGGGGWSQWIPVDDGQIRAQANGNYEFQANASASGVTNGTFTVTDRDGDPDTANWAFNITDANVPTAGTSNARLDDDGLAGGNAASSTGDIDANVGEIPVVNTNEAIFHGQLTLSFGGDGPGTVTFAAMHGLGGVVGTENVLYSWSGSTLTATVNGGARNGTVLFDIVVNQTTGEYTLTLRDNVIHTPGGNENSAPNVALTYTVTDSDNSPAGGVNGTMNIEFNDDAPTVTSLGAQPELTTDDSTLGTNASASFAGVFTPAFGADGAAAANSVTYALGVSAPGGVASGVFDVATGNQVFLFLEGGQVVGREGTNAADAVAGDIVFNVSVSGTGVVTLDQVRAVQHNDPADPVETGASAAGLSADNLVTLTATVTDGDGDTASASANIGSNLHFEDAGPTISVTAAAEPVLVVDDTTLGTNASSSFAALFNASFGADGAAVGGGLSYALSVTAGPSGIIDVASGQAVNLSVVGGVVEGRTAGSNLLVFTVTVDSSGVVTLDQVRAVQHNDPADHDEAGASAATLTLDSLVRLTATATDRDGDSATATVNIGQNLQFKDDGPSITATGTQPNLTVDDTTLGVNASASFAGAFSPVFGADGQGAPPVSYALGVSAPGGVASGLFDVATGNQVFLFLEGGQVVGREGTNAGDAVAGDIVFNVSVNGSGVVTLDQVRAVQHNDPADPVETGGSAAGLSADNLITLIATARDGDNDTASASIGIGSNLRFEDDGPSMNATGTQPILVVDDTTLLTNASASFAGAFGASFGADGAALGGGQSYALSVTAGPSGLFDVATGQAVNLSMNGAVVEGRTAGSNQLVFTVTVNGSGLVTLDQVRAVQHNDPADPDEPGASAATLTLDSLVRLTATATDRDGDTASASIDIGHNLQFRDDGPAATNDTSQAAAVSQDLNVAFILDFSESINNTELDTQLDAVIAAATELFNNTNGTVRVDVVLFSTSAKHLGEYTDLASFIAAINGVNPGAGGTRPGDIGTRTNFTAGLEVAMANYTPDINANNQVFFLSDGNPNEPSGISTVHPIATSTAQAWNTFVDSNFLHVTAIGVGGDIETGPLQAVDVDGQGLPIMVGAFDELIDALLDQITSPSISGNVLSNGDSFGADGGRILSITFNGITYTYNSSTDDITVSGGGGTIDGSELVDLPTTQGGTFSFSFANANGNQAGDWEYTPPTIVTEPESDQFNYVLVDGDGDTSSATLTINLIDNDTPQTAASNVSVSEEGLAGGLPDGTGTPDTTNSATANGTVTFNDPDGPPLTVSLGVPTTSLTSNGAAVTWVVSPDGQTLTGSVGMTTVLTVAITSVNTVGPNTNVNYAVTLLQPVDQPNGQIEDAINLVVPVLGSDGFVTTTSKVNVSIEDDVSANRAQDDMVITSIDNNGATIIIPEAALLWNDNPGTVITGAASFIVDATSVNRGGGNFTFVDDGDETGGSFVYSTTPSPSDTATVTVDRQQDGDTTLDGTGSGEILIARNSNDDTIQAGGGNDYAMGLDGNDTINGGDGNDFLDGGNGNDVLNGGNNDDVLVGRAGADTMDGGSGTNLFIIAAGDTAVSIGGSGNGGTISGFDRILSFDTVNDTIDLPGTPAAAANTAGVDGANSTLTISGQTVKSHAISNGIITFDDADTYASALTISSTGNIAAVVQYLRANDIGAAGTTVAFVANGDTYIYQQVGDTPNATNDILIELDGLVVANLGTLIGAGRITPVVLDMDGDGAEFLGISAGVSYDYGNGSVGTAWVGADDAILVRDANGDGDVTASEFVFGGNGMTDLEALHAQYGEQLDASDADFTMFAVWNDANSNGVVDSNELQSLAEAGIASIGLVSDGDSYSAANDDVAVAGTASYTRTDGSTGDVADASFSTGSAARANQEVERVAANSNNVALAAAVAAAGMAASTAAAAAPGLDGPIHQSGIGDASVGKAAYLSDGSGNDYGVSVLNAYQGAALDHGADVMASTSRAALIANHIGELSTAGSAGHGPTALLEATDFGATFNAPTPAMPMAVAMPSAAMLTAASAGIAETASVEQIVADALQGGEGGVDINALLSALPGAGLGENAGLKGLTTLVNEGVSTWDTGHGGVFTFDAASIITTEAMVLHHDAVQPVANG